MKRELFLMFFSVFLKCFNAVGWVTGMLYCLKKTLSLN